MAAILTCQEIVELVTDYLEGGLGPAERLAFERHVAVCPPCRGYLAQLRRIVALAPGLREDELPRELRERLGEAFAEWARERRE